jgi:hypothetical protein
MSKVIETVFWTIVALTPIFGLFYLLKNIGRKKPKSKIIPFDPADLSHYHKYPLDEWEEKIS